MGFDIEPENNYAVLVTIGNHFTYRVAASSRPIWEARLIHL